MEQRTWALVVAIAVVMPVVLSADTLVLRDGRRLQGDVMSVRDGVIEFDAQRGLFGRERMRVDQRTVARIEFDESAPAPENNLGPGSGSNTPSRPSGLREKDISVNAAAAWTDAGMGVRRGQTIYFHATGRVRWGPNRQDGPAGERNSPRNAARPIPSRPAAALIGRIGESDIFFIGDDEGPIRVRQDGQLYLGINDDGLKDNSGAFRVTVYY